MLDRTCSESVKMTSSTYGVILRDYPFRPNTIILQCSKEICYLFLQPFIPDTKEPGSRNDVLLRLEWGEKGVLIRGKRFGMLGSQR